MDLVGVKSRVWFKLDIVGYATLNVKRLVGVLAGQRVEETSVIRVATSGGTVLVLFATMAMELLRKELKVCGTEKLLTDAFRETSTACNELIGKLVTFLCVGAARTGPGVSRNDVFGLWKLCEDDLCFEARFDVLVVIGNEIEDEVTIFIVPSIILVIVSLNDGLDSSELVEENATILVVLSRNGSKYEADRAVGGLELDDAGTEDIAKGEMTEGGSEGLFVKMLVLLEDIGCIGDGSPVGFVEMLTTWTDFDLV